MTIEQKKMRVADFCQSHNCYNCPVKDKCDVIMGTDDAPINMDVSKENRYGQVVAMYDAIQELEEKKFDMPDLKKVNVVYVQFSKGAKHYLYTVDSKATIHKGDELVVDNGSHRAFVTATTDSCVVSGDFFNTLIKELGIKSVESIIGRVEKF